MRWIQTCAKAENGTEVQTLSLLSSNLLALRGEGTYFSNFANTSATMVLLSMALSTCPLYSKSANMFLLSSMASGRVDLSCPPGSSRHHHANPLLLGFLSHPSPCCEIVSLPHFNVLSGSLTFDLIFRYISSSGS